MILEEGTDQQLKECAWRACLPLPGERWLVTGYTSTGIRVEHPVECKAFRIVQSDSDYSITVFSAKSQSLLETVSVEDWLHSVTTGIFFRPRSRR